MKRDIYGHANSTCSLFVQALLGEKSNGRLYENIAFTLHLRDKDNKASRTKAFYLDKQIANVWGCDLAHPGCNRVFESRKQVKGQYRSSASSAIMRSASMKRRGCTTNNRSGVKTPYGYHFF
jgi:hypothetical protein